MVKVLRVIGDFFFAAVPSLVGGKVRLPHTPLDLPATHLSTCLPHTPPLACHTPLHLPATHLSTCLPHTSPLAALLALPSHPHAHRHIRLPASYRHLLPRVYIPHLAPPSHVAAPHSARACAAHPSAHLPLATLQRERRLKRQASVSGERHLQMCTDLSTLRWSWDDYILIHEILAKVSTKSRHISSKSPHTSSKSRQISSKSHPGLTQINL